MWQFKRNMKNLLLHVLNVNIRNKSCNLNFIEDSQRLWKKINKKLLILILNFKDNHLIVLSSWFLILMTSCFTKLCSFLFQIILCWDFLNKQIHTCNKVINKEDFCFEVMLGNIMWVGCLCIFVNFKNKV